MFYKFGDSGFKIAYYLLPQRQLEVRAAIKPVCEKPDRTLCLPQALNFS